MSLSNEGRLLGLSARTLVVSGNQGCFVRGVNTVRILVSCQRQMPRLDIVSAPPPQVYLEWNALAAQVPILQVPGLSAI